ncbi:ZCHC3 protein, partial [Atractosteus spatula]|nr:ZCHC3 protein [Atractosteus spatula]
MVIIDRYPLSNTESVALEKYIQESLKARIIHPSTSPACSSFFFVKEVLKLLIKNSLLIKLEKCIFHISPQLISRFWKEFCLLPHNSLITSATGLSPFQCSLGYQHLLLPDSTLYSDLFLREDPEGVEGFQHPPAHFTIGANRGYLYYPRMPYYCKKCRKSGHKENTCDIVRCHNCNMEGHTAKNCQAAKVSKPSFTQVEKGSQLKQVARQKEEGENRELTPQRPHHQPR